MLNTGSLEYQRLCKKLRTFTSKYYINDNRWIKDRTEEEKAIIFEDIIEGLSKFVKRSKFFKGLNVKADIFEKAFNYTYNFDTDELYVTNVTLYHKLISDNDALLMKYEIGEISRYELKKQIQHNNLEAMNVLSRSRRPYVQLVTFIK